MLAILIRTRGSLALQGVVLLALGLSLLSAANQNGATFLPSVLLDVTLLACGLHALSLGLSLLLLNLSFIQSSALPEAGERDLRSVHSFATIVHVPKRRNIVSVH